MRKILQRFYESLVKNERRGVLFLLSFFLLTGSAFAQRNVSGRVTDANADGLPGVTILVKGTTNGTTTDLDGNYQLSVDNNATLIFSYIGFVTQEIPVGSRTDVSVTLEEDLDVLEEVVVIGYGTVKKSDLTGAVTQIETKDFNKGNINTPQDLLVGRIPGVSAITNSGAPGEDAQIRIRGGSSLSASNNPLFVIDDVILADETVSGSRNPLSLINPNDIATINVLKDASATAIYGSRASNGVIIITTKRGSAGQKPTFSYSGKFTVSSIPETLDIFNTQQFRSFISGSSDRLGDGGQATQLLDTVGFSGVGDTDFIVLNPNVSTDWQDLIYRDAFTQDHSLSVSGGLTNLPDFLDNLPYRVSIGYTDQQGVVEKTNFDRLSTSLALNPSLLNDKIKLNINTKYSTTKNVFIDDGVIGNAVRFDPTKPVFWPSGSERSGYFYWPQNNTGLRNNISTQNPVALLDQTDDEATVNRFIGNFKATYNTPIKGLSATVNAAYDRTTTDGLDLISQDAIFATDFEGDQFARSGQRRIYSAEYKNELLEGYLNYTVNIPSINADLTVTAGATEQYFFRETREISFRTLVDEQVWTNPLGDTLDVANNNKSENIIKSQFGRLNLNVSDRYLITATVRRDGSSRFEGDNQWGVFPSVAVGWRLASESFMQDVTFVSDLKLRAGWGITGQENIRPDGDGTDAAYPAERTLTIGDDLARQFFGGGLINVARPNGFNADLKWEETTTINFGVDFGFLNNRLTGSFDIYQRETEDIINLINVQAGTNFTNRLFTNVGSLEINGWEAGINGILVDNEDWRVSLGANVTHNDIEITNLTLVDDPNFPGVETGAISGINTNAQIHSLGFHRSTFWLYEQIYDQDGNPVDGLYVDQNGDGLVNNSDRVRSENPDPDYLFGFNGQFGYKNFTLGFNGRLSVGNYAYNDVSAARNSFGGVWNSSGYIENTVANFGQQNFTQTQPLSDHWLEDASFFRMDNITLGYNVASFLSDKIDASFSFTVQNAFLITDYSGVDPELNNGIDNNLYPRPRNFVLGLNLNFR